MKIAGVILAAGKSSRMGQNKLLLKYNDHTVIEETVDQLLNSNVGNVIVVTGFQNQRIKELLAKYPGDRITIVDNRNYRLGRAESIKCALRQIGDQADAVLFMVGDKPQVRCELINRAIDRFKEDKPAILYVTTPAGRGHPIMFSRKLFAALRSLDGDCVGDELIARYKNDVVELEDPMVQVDIDTAQDYRRLTKKRRS